MSIYYHIVIALTSLKCWYENNKFNLILNRDVLFMLIDILNAWPTGKATPMLCAAAEIANK